MSAPMNHLDLKPGRPIFMGNYGGKPVVAEVLPWGGVATTANPLVRARAQEAGEIVSEEYRLASEQASQFTIAEHAAITRRSGLLSLLNGLAAGRLSVEGVNEWLKTFQIDARVELQGLGVDPARSFHINHLELECNADGSIRPAAGLDTLA